MCPCIVPILIPASMNKSRYLNNHMQKPNYDKLNSSHACGYNKALFYFLFWFSEIMFKNEIKIVF